MTASQDMYLQPEEEQEITEEGNEELLQVDQGLKDMYEYIR
jgi:hypothetical protein